MRSKQKGAWASPSPTDEPVLEPNRLGSSPNRGRVHTLGYTLMGMAAAGAPADALTDAHLHSCRSTNTDGAFRSGATDPRQICSVDDVGQWRCVDQALSHSPAAGARSFRERVDRAKRWLLSAKAFSTERTIHAAQCARGCRRVSIRTRSVRERH